MKTNNIYFLNNTEQQKSKHSDNISKDNIPVKKVVRFDKKNH